jgi:hypothetical protein
MPCVSDNGATAPISALTYAFSIGSDRGPRTDDFSLRIIALVTRASRGRTVSVPSPDPKRTGRGPRPDCAQIGRSQGTGTGLKVYRTRTACGPMTDHMRTASGPYPDPGPCRSRLPMILRPESSRSAAPMRCKLAALITVRQPYASQCPGPTTPSQPDGMGIRERHPRCTSAEANARVDPLGPGRCRRLLDPQRPSAAAARGRVDVMTLEPKLPPGRANRKALRFTVDIRRLRSAGYTFSAIRAALLDVGVEVSLTTIKREAARQGIAPLGVPRTAVAPSMRPAPVGVHEGPSSAPPVARGISGRETAEAFFKANPSNPLFPPKESP